MHRCTNHDTLTDSHYRNPELQWPGLFPRAWAALLYTGTAEVVTMTGGRLIRRHPMLKGIANAISARAANDCSASLEHATCLCMPESS